MTLNSLGFEFPSILNLDPYNCAKHKDVTKVGLSAG